LPEKWVDSKYICDTLQISPRTLQTFHDNGKLAYSKIELFGMIWMNECTVEDGATQRLFVAHSKAEDNKPERLMFCTYPFEKVSYAIQKCTKLLLNWFLLYPKEDF
jgi:hypothetical protein